MRVTAADACVLHFINSWKRLFLSSKSCSLKTENEAQSLSNLPAICLALEVVLLSPSGFDYRFRHSRRADAPDFDNLETYRLQ